MISYCDLVAQTFPVAAYCAFILAVSANRQRRFGKDALERLLAVDQQTTGAGSDKDLDTRTFWAVRKIVDVVFGGADIEAKVDVRNSVARAYLASIPA